MKKELTIFDKLMVAITFAEDGDPETAIEIMNSIEEESTVSGVTELYPA